MDHGPAASWTLGGSALLYERCGRCVQRWYFSRGFCPHCGSAEVSQLVSKGFGTALAATTVHRAPNDLFRALLPYRLVLVQLDEGFRAMAHAEPGVEPGSRVHVGVCEIGGRNEPRATVIVTVL